MTIVSRPTVEHYRGDGVQTQWPVGFAFFRPEHVRAGLSADEGELVLLEQGRDYVVRCDEGFGGGIVECSVPEGQRLTIWLDQPFTQDVDLRNTGVLDAEVLEQACDRLTLMAQQLRDELARCIKVGIHADVNPDGLLQKLDASVSASMTSSVAALAAKAEAEVARAGAEAAKTGAEAARDEAASRILPIPVAEAAGKAVVVSVGGGYGLEGVKPFPAGTRLLFQQSTAPTGWTKDTTVNDKALRVVSGAVGSGGVTGFSSIFSRTMVDSTTLVASQMPGHAHEVIDSVGTYVRRAGNAGGGIQVIRTTDNGTGATNSTQLVTGTQGGNGSHTHGPDLRLAYIDVIIATKV